MIEINTDSVTISEEGGTIFANIFLKLNNNLFYPQKEWNDFAAIILSWWSREIIDYVNGTIDLAEFCFMDGDYMYRITKKGEFDILRCYYNPYASNNLVAEEKINITHFISDLKSCINKLLLTIGKREAKLEALPEYLKDLSALLKKGPKI